MTKEEFIEKQIVQLTDNTFLAADSKNHYKPFKTKQKAIDYVHKVWKDITIEDLARAEQEDQYNNIVKYLFGGTEHVSSNGVSSAIEWLLKLIDKGLIPLDLLLYRIGERYKP